MKPLEGPMDWKVTTPPTTFQTPHPVTVVDGETHVTDAGELVTCRPHASHRPVVRKRGVLLHSVLLQLPARLSVCVRSPPR
jgi:hypothetical protein